MEEIKIGTFVTFEGIEGSGKGTQVHMLYEHLVEEGYDVVATREPGSTAIGDIIRDALLNTKFEEMTPKTELFLFAAARAQHVEEVIKPALSAGKIVICDRFTDSMLAYQSYGRGLEFQKVLRLADMAASSIVPDLTIFLEIPVEIAFNRIKHERKLDRIELADHGMHNRIAAGYLKLADRYAERFQIVDASKPQLEVHKAITKIVKDLL